MFYTTTIARATDGLIFVSYVISKAEANKDINVEVFRSQSKSILKTLSSNSPNMLQITSDEYVFTYIIEDNICYLTCTEKDCQKRVCFGYLEDIKKCFLNYVQGEYHDKYVSLKR